MTDTLRSLVRPIVASARARGLLLALAVTYAYFVPAPAWNENSRFALTRALVEHGTTRIDAYHFTTGDKSYRDGHFYCDKAPGASLLAVVPYALYYGARRLVGAAPPKIEVIPLDPLDLAAKRVPTPEAMAPGDRLRFDAAYRVGLYVCNLGTTVLASLLAAAALWLLATRALGERSREAYLVVIAYALATPAFVYTTALYGHQLAASLLFVAFAALAAITPVDNPKRARGVAWLVGTALGWAVLCEYPSVVPVLILVSYAARRHGVRFAVEVALAGLPWALLLAAYHTAAFGGPLQTGYDHVYLPEFAEGMAVRYGISLPDPRVLLAITFGDFRGLFYVAPVLLLGSWGWIAHAGWRERDGGELGLDRGARIVAVAIVGFYLLLNASYYMWDGGSAFGPRHLVPILPWLALGTAPMLVRHRSALLVVGAYSLLINLVAAHAGPLMPQWGDPVWEHAWPRLFRTTGTVLDGPTNAGRLLGLSGVFALVPLVALWIWLRPWAVSSASLGDDMTE